MRTLNLILSAVEDIKGLSEEWHPPIYVYTKVTLWLLCMDCRVRSKIGVGRSGGY